jgi:hypothetical protein
MSMTEAERLNEKLWSNIRQLQARVAELLSENTSLADRNNMMRIALQTYADENNWHLGSQWAHHVAYKGSSIALNTINSEREMVNLFMAGKKNENVTEAELERKRTADADEKRERYGWYGLEEPK